jgi:AcrR family transcriptional regulator
MSVSTSARRRDPVQERSHETVSRVLAGAGRLLARGVSPQGLTTAQIAAEAGLSVGALYRFFPDKQAVVDAIALRHLETFQDGMATRLMLALPESPDALMGAVIDGFAAYLEENADFRTVAYGPPGGGSRAISSALFEAQSGTGELAGMVREVLAEMFGLPTSGEDFGFRLRIAIEIGDRLLAHAFTQEGAARARVLDEAKAILAAYLFGPAA